MNKFLLNISSPDGEKFKDEIVKLSVRGVEGDLAVMAGHIPFVTSLKPCTCKLEFEDGSIRTAKVSGGLLTVGVEHVTLLSSSFEWNSDE